VLQNVERWLPLGPGSAPPRQTASARFVGQSRTSYAGRATAGAAHPIYHRPSNTTHYSTPYPLLLSNNTRHRLAVLQIVSALISPSLISRSRSRLSSATFATLVRPAQGFPSCCRVLFPITLSTQPLLNCQRRLVVQCIPLPESLKSACPAPCPFLCCTQYILIPCLRRHCSRGLCLPLRALQPQPRHFRSPKPRT
jgi:hypothetical protein